MKKILFSALLILVGFLGLNTSLKAHVVQIGYCVNCDDVLRLYLEHWHGNADPSSTTMTISVTVNGVTTTYTGSPLVNLQDTPAAKLPGCATPLTVFASCPGTGPQTANYYNDWISYDFPQVPCGVPVSFSVISGSNAFTSDGCNMYPATSGTFTVPCGKSSLPVSNLTVCAGDSFPPVIFPPQPGVVYTWSNSDTTIGLGSSGMGNIAPFLALNNTLTPIVSVCSVYYSCIDTAFTFTVAPLPRPSFSEVTYCHEMVFTGGAETSTSTGNVTKWEWDFNNDGTIDTVGPNPEFRGFPRDGSSFTMKLTITSENGCTKDTVVSVTPSPPPTPNIIHTNIFTPNGDGKNDLFHFGTQDLTTIDVQIYDRWGKKVYSWTDVNGSWDGKTLAGKKAAEGTYYYYFTAEGTDCVTYEHQGFFTLSR